MNSCYRLHDILIFTIFVKYFNTEAGIGSIISEVVSFVIGNDFDF